MLALPCDARYKVAVVMLVLAVVLRLVQAGRSWRIRSALFLLISDKKEQLLDRRAQCSCQRQGQNGGGHKDRVLHCVYGFARDTDEGCEIRLGQASRCSNLSYPVTEAALSHRVLGLRLRPANQR